VITITAIQPKQKATTQSMAAEPTTLEKKKERILYSSRAHLLSGCIRSVEGIFVRGSSVGKGEYTVTEIIEYVDPGKQRRAQAQTIWKRTRRPK